MTDRELLEAAAKAAAIQIFDWRFDERNDSWHGARSDSEEATVYWSPLTNDGDALRLAVMLRLDIFMAAPGSPDATVEVIAIHGKDEAPFAIETLDGGDPYAATRRAIVRAAATMASSEQK
jgi:hypothetical protein